MYGIGKAKLQTKWPGRLEKTQIMWRILNLIGHAPRIPKGLKYN
jgi:hypothetical protein